MMPRSHNDVVTSLGLLPKGEPEVLALIDRIHQPTGEVDAIASAELALLELEIFVLQLASFAVLNRHAYRRNDLIRLGEVDYFAFHHQNEGTAFALPVQGDVFELKAEVLIDSQAHGLIDGGSRGELSDNAIPADDCTDQ